jgi:hypothetical protein
LEEDLPCDPSSRRGKNGPDPDVHQNDCFVSRDELQKVQKKYGNKLYKGTDAYDNQNLINYEHFSKDMGLHHSYLDYIQKNQLD